MEEEEEDPYAYLNQQSESENKFEIVHKEEPKQKPKPKPAAAETEENETEKIQPWVADMAEQLDFDMTDAMLETSESLDEMVNQSFAEEMEKKKVR